MEEKPEGDKYFLNNFENAIQPNGFEILSGKRMGLFLGKACCA
jgi:hypothetical protein